ncbi:MAG: hypothetical protein ABJA94_10460 [Rhodoglobus sp.]
MQIFTRKSALLTARFDGSTGKRRSFRYGWRAIAAAAVLALLAGSGIAVAAVASAAEAHVPTSDSTCYSLHVNAKWYNTGNDGKGINTVVVIIDGQQKTSQNFATDFDQTYPLNPSVDHSYSVTITGYDWQTYTDTKGTKACAPPSILNLGVPVCSKAGDVLDLTANLQSLDISHAFTIELSSSDGGTTVAAQPFTPSGATYSYAFHSVLPGHNYTVTVVDTTTKQSVNKSALLVGCPKDSGIDVQPTQCSAPGGTSGFGVSLSSLSIGRTYTVSVVNATTNAVLQTKPATGDANGNASLSFDVAAGGKYKATVVDDLAPTVTKTSAPLEYLPCPKTPDIPKIDPTQCTTTDGKPNSSITFSASGLVPGRTYQVTISNGTTNVFDSGAFVAASSDFAEQTLPFPPGTYTVTVADVLLNTYVTSASATLIDCPLLPNLDIQATQCSVPGGTASIALTVSNYVAGRSYTFAVTQNGAPVGTADTLVAPAAIAVAGAAAPTWSPTLAALNGLPAGLVYRLIVTDTVVPTVMASGDVALTVCPGDPTISVKATCNVFGASTANVGLAQLVAGQNYSVTIVKTSNSTVLSSQTVTGATATAALQFKNVPNGNTYTVNIVNTASTLKGTTTFALAKCDLPTLAFTGANPVGPAVAGIGFLQLGVMLLALSLVVRRRRTI